MCVKYDSLPYHQVCCLSTDNYCAFKIPIFLEESLKQHIAETNKSIMACRTLLLMSFPSTIKGFLDNCEPDRECNRPQQ